MKLLVYLLVCLSLIGFLVLLFREPILLKLGNFLIIQDSLQPADVIHVISGPGYRTNYGIQLYKQGYAKNIFFTGGWCSEIQGVHADRGRQQAIEQGIPAAAVGTDPYPVISTYQEAERLKLWIEQTHMPVHAIIVVSDPHHMQRARWTYQQIFGKGDIMVVMAPVPFEQTPFQKRWWLDRDSKDMVASEYIKLFYYYARYKYGWGPIKDWLASFDTE